MTAIVRFEPSLSGMNCQTRSAAKASEHRGGRDPDLLRRQPDRDLLRRRGLAERQGVGRRRQGLFDPAKLGEQLVRALVALLVLLFQALQDERAEVLRDLGVERPRVGRRLALLLDGDAERRLALERQPPGQHLEEDDAQRVDVRARVGLLAVDLLGRHVFGRPDHRPRRR